MTEAEFRRRLMEESVSIEEIERDMAFAIFLVEKTTGAFIDESYPMLKFHSQCENLEKYRKMEAKAYAKAKGKR